MPTRPVKIPLYLVVIGFMVMLVSPGLSVLAAVNIAENNTKEALEAQRQSNCDFFGRALDEYAQNPPTSELGLGLRDQYLNLYRQNKCKPER